MVKNSNNPVWLTIREGAQRIGVSYEILAQWIREDRLPAVRYGTHLIRIDQADLDAFTEAHRTGS